MGYTAVFLGVLLCVLHIRVVFVCAGGALGVGFGFGVVTVLVICL